MQAVTNMNYVYAANHKAGYIDGSTNLCCFQKKRFESMCVLKFKIENNHISKKFVISSWNFSNICSDDIQFKNLGKIVKLKI